MAKPTLEEIQERMARAHYPDYDTVDESVRPFYRKTMEPPALIADSIYNEAYDDGSRDAYRNNSIL